MRWRKQLGYILGVSFCIVAFLREYAYANEELQWYLQEIGQDINEREDLEQNNSSEPVVIAIIDTGVYADHEALKESLWVNEAERTGEEGVDDDANGYVDDIHGYNIKGKNGNITDTDGHGTHIAGIIGMKPTDKNEYIGVFPNAKLMIVKAGNTSNGFTSANLIKAIKYAVENGADVINMSLGTSYCTEELRETIGEAAKKVVLVAAAGNLGVPTAESGYLDAMNIFPAGLDEVIGVMSFDRDKEVASYSNWDYQAGVGVDYNLIAPGSEIYSTTLYNKYKYETGTSMSTAIVSAACGRVIAEWEKYGDAIEIWTPEKVQKCLLEGVEEKVAMVDKDGREHSFSKVSIKAAVDYFYTNYYVTKEPIGEVVTGSATITGSGVITGSSTQPREEIEEKKELEITVEVQEEPTIKPTTSVKEGATLEETILGESYVSEKIPQPNATIIVETNLAPIISEEKKGKEETGNSKYKEAMGIGKEKPWIKICKQDKKKMKLKYHLKNGKVTGYRIYYGKTKNGKFILLKTTKKKKISIKKKGFYYVVAYYKTKEGMCLSKKSICVRK